MLSIEDDNWSRIDIGDFHERLLNINDVSLIVLQGILDYKQNDYCIMEFSGESFVFKLIIMEYDIYIIEDAYSIICQHIDLPPQKVIEEMYNDVAFNIKKWAEWYCITEKQTAPYMQNYNFIIHDIQNYYKPEPLHLISRKTFGQYPIQRDVWQEWFNTFLMVNDFDFYGYTERVCKNLSPGASFENETFLIRPYYWGDEDGIIDLPNFVFKPTDYELWWYKYPLRDSYANQAISFKAFKRMLGECETSL